MSSVVEAHSNNTPPQSQTESVANVSSSSSSSSDSLHRTFGRYPRIDVHTHILPEHIPDLAARYGYGSWIRLEHHCSCKAKMYKGSEFFREIEENCYRTDPRIKECDDLNVDVQVLSTVPVMFNYQAKPEDTLDLAMFLNDHIASICKKHPERFIGLGTVPMQEPELAIKEMRRCINELGMVGIQIGTHINTWTLAEPKLFPVFQEAERLGCCIFIHPWDMVGGDLMKKYWLPWLVGMPMETCWAICSLIFGGVFEKLPNLRVCFAHGGGSFPGTIGRIQHGFEARPDLCAIDCKTPPRDFLGRFWVDSLVHDTGAFSTLLSLVGPDKIVLGTDYPFPLGELIPGQLVESQADLTVEVREKILWKNALSFLGLDHKEDFFLNSIQQRKEKRAALLAEKQKEESDNKELTNTTDSITSAKETSESQRDTTGAAVVTLTEETNNISLSS